MAQVWGVGMVMEWLCTGMCACGAQADEHIVCEGAKDGKVEEGGSEGGGEEKSGCRRGYMWW